MFKFQALGCMTRPQKDDYIRSLHNEIRRFESLNDKATIKALQEGKDKILSDSAQVVRVQSNHIDLLDARVKELEGALNEISNFEINLIVFKHMKEIPKKMKLIARKALLTNKQEGKPLKK